MKSLQLDFKKFLPLTELSRKRSSYSFSFEQSMYLCLLFCSIFTTQNLMAQPATPAGFVANPSAGVGEVFLACGPNQTADVDIIYRLYYSPTASAPGDPLTATEYTFGSTPGDGNGDNAFGFNISGLTPGTDYTFWLYQYNTSTMEFSNPPAIATQTSGAAGGPPQTPVGLVCNTPADGPGGEIFIACGPNQTGDADIIYRLYYSPTASAPGDPLTATEYTFGSTPGDGNGDNAFGFRLSGLTPDVDYTIWLYQYNTAVMLHSDVPASCTTTSSDVPLPVTWLAPLRATLMDDNSIGINWSVASQLNNEKFLIEFSKDGVDFRTIDEIEGEGTNNEIMEYSYIHTEPSKGANYYRITQVDYDGTYSRSNIASIRYGDIQTIKLYPNPASTLITIESSENTIVHLKDYYGRLLKTRTLAEGINEISIDDLANGMYILESGDGQVQNFIKK